MSSAIKSLAKTLLARAGLELKKIENSGSEEACAARLFAKARTDLMVDVGANNGQYAQKILHIVPGVRIISFEPLSQAHVQLLASARHIPQWQVADRCAIGDSDGVIEINISKNSVSSSILPMETTHQGAAPESIYVGAERVPIKRLDTALPPYLKAQDKIYLKIDTQGYEKNVLMGATGVLPHVRAIQLELSLVELYRGQVQAFEMIDFVRSLGFHLFGLSNGFADSQTGELLQVDAFFIARSL